MAGVAGDPFAETTGSGKAGIVSTADDVSMVMCFVEEEPFLMA